MELILPSGWRWRSPTSVEGQLLERIAAARGIGAKELPLFLTPDFYAHFHDPLQLPGMREAVTRLRQALDKQEHILIFGDYDADGIPATAIAIRGLQQLGHQQIEAIIPTRRSGYGLCAAQVEEIIRRQPDLVVTVDTGVSSAVEVAQLRSAGIEVIVTDHHESPDTLPDTVVVNPKLPESTYPNRDLVGSAVIYKVLWQLYTELGVDLTPLKYLLDLVALATMADLMPLTGENRALVIYGLKVLQRTKNLGLRSLLLMGGIVPSQAEYRHLSFFLAPRLNALSRLGLDESEQDEQWGNLALALLLADNPARADILARRLHEINESRKELIGSYHSSLKGVAPDGGEPVVLYIPDVPVGLLGLLAGSLVEQHGVPALVMSQDSDGTVRGSGRSPKGFPGLPDVLGQAKGLVQRFGGHKEAAGWSLSPENVAEFTVAVKELLQSPPGSVAADVSLDTYLTPEESNLRSAQVVHALAPFGQDNPEPSLFIQDTLRSLRPVGKDGSHAKLLLNHYPSLEVMWFRHNCAELPSPGTLLSLAGGLSVNTFREPAPQFVVEEAVW